MPNKYMSWIEKTNSILFGVAVCLLPYPTQVSLYAWVIWLFSWLLEGRFLHKEYLQWHKGLIPLLWMVIWVACEGVSYAWSIAKNDTVDLLVRHLSFILIIPIALFGVNRYYNWKWVSRCFVLSVICSLFLYGFYIYFVCHWDYICANHQLPEHVRTWTYYGDQITAVKHRFYYGTVMNLAVIAVLKSRGGALTCGKWRDSVFFFVKLLLLVIGIVMTGSRVNLLVLVVIGAVAILQLITGKIRMWMTTIVSAVTVMIMVLVFSLHPRFIQLYTNNVSQQEFYPSYEVEPRMNIWYMALQTPKDYFWHGVGAGGDTEYLKPIYLSYQMDAFSDREFNVHNQYLCVLIDLGIFVAVFFLIIWLTYPCFYKGKLRQLATLIALLIGLNMLTENMLGRIDGVIITCFSLLVLALLSRQSITALDTKKT